MTQLADAMLSVSLPYQGYKAAIASRAADGSDNSAENVTRAAAARAREALEALGRSFGRWQSRRELLRAADRLDDHLLADIGVSRAEVRALRDGVVTKIGRSESDDRTTQETKQSKTPVYGTGQLPRRLIAA